MGFLPPSLHKTKTQRPVKRKESAIILGTTIET